MPTTPAGIQAAPGVQKLLLYVSAKLKGKPRPALFNIGIENTTFKLALLTVSKEEGVKLENGGIPVATWL